MTRDPIGYAGGINLYAYCSGNPVTRVDPDGLTDYNANYVRGQIKLWQKEGGIWQAKKNHGGNGIYDYKVHMPEDRFMVHGLWLSASQFGQYAVGYASYYNAGSFGLWGAQAAGHWYEGGEDNMRDDNEVAFIFDDGTVDKKLIMLGAVDAYMDKRKQGKEKPASFGWQTRPGANKSQARGYVIFYNTKRTGTIHNRPDSPFNQPKNSWTDRKKRSRWP